MKKAMSILAALVPSRFLYYTDIIKSKEGTLMTKQEISEIKKLFTPKNCSITRICGCYVDGEKNKKTELKQAFLALPEEEMFKYFEILRKSLSGTIGKNLLNLEFPLKSETEGGTQEFLLRLRIQPLLSLRQLLLLWLSLSQQLLWWKLC